MPSQPVQLSQGEDDDDDDDDDDCCSSSSSAFSAISLGFTIFGEIFACVIFFGCCCCQQP